MRDCSQSFGSWPSHSCGHDSGQASATVRRFVVVVIVVESFTQPSASARKTKAVPLKVRSAAAAESLPSSSFAIDPALRMHHNRKLFENLYVAGHCYFEAQAVSNMLAHGMGEKQGSKSMRSIYAAFCSGSKTQLWLLRDRLDRTELQNFLGTLPLLQKPKTLQSAPPLSL
jgi:hypothetical protein